MPCGVFSDNQCWQATGGTYASPNDYTAAKPAESTPRQPRESDSSVCAFRLPAPATEVSLQCHACEVAWSAVECRVLMCRLTRARQCSLVSWHDKRGHVVESDSGYHASTTPTHSLPVHREQVPASCASSRLWQTHKTHHHGLRRYDHVDPDVEREKL